MCGFTIWYNKNKNINQKLFIDSANLIENRGPDYSKSYFFNNDKKIENQNSNIDLAINHKRLKIIDTSNLSNQPMFSENKRDIILFNGAIYNFKELKDIYKFTTKSSGDTEVLLKLISNFNINKLNEANGMWAIVFIKDFKEIILSKDRYGKKPLYYFIDDKNFIVSSEIKVIFNILNIPRKVNINYLNEFLLTKRWPRNNDNQTFYKDINRLEAGQILNFNTQNFKYSINKLDNLYKTQKKISKNELKNDLISSIKIRLRADVKIGILLSGGIDSSMIAYLASLEINLKKNITFYTIEDLENDLCHAILLSKYLKIKLKKISIKNNVSDFTKFHKFAKKSAECLEMPINYRNFALTSY